MADRVLLKFPIPEAVWGDRRFDKIMAAIEQVFNGVAPERLRALDEALRANGLDPHNTWQAMALAASSAVAMLYAQRERFKAGREH